MLRRTLLISIFALISACGGPGESANVPEAQPAGATSVDTGNHIVHFSAQSTDQLPPAVAREYNIVRSKNRAMLNVSVIGKSDSRPVSAEVTVNTVNLTGQLKNITMREIKEGREDQDEIVAIYYIGDTTVANREVLVFDISVRPEGEETVSKLRFKRQFYSD
jgi:hypothetical protein